MGRAGKEKERGRRPKRGSKARPYSLLGGEAVERVKVGLALTSFKSLGLPLDLIYKPKYLHNIVRLSMNFNIINELIG